MKKLKGLAIFLIVAQLVLLILIITSGTVVSKSSDTFVKFNGNQNKVDTLTIESNFLNGENNSIDLNNKIRPGMGKIYGIYEKEKNVSQKYEKPYSNLNPLKHKEKWVLEYDPYFGPKRKVEVVISYKNGVKVNSVDDDKALIDIIPKDILRKKKILDPDFFNNNPKLKNHLLYEDKELTKPINDFNFTNDEINKLTDIYAVSVNKGNYNFTIEYRKFNESGELIDFSNTNLVNIFNYDSNTKQFKGKGDKDQLIPLMYPRLLGFKPKSPDKTSFKLENDNLIYTVVYEKNPTDYHQITFYSGNFGTLNGKSYFEVLKNDKTLIENGVIAPLVKPVKGKLFTGWSPAFNPQSRIDETKIYVAQYTDDPQYSSEYNYRINYFIKGTSKPVPGINPNPVMGKGTLSYALAIKTPVAVGYEVAKNEAFEVVINENDLTINVYYVENNKQFSYKVLYMAKLAPGVERQIPYPVQEGFGSVGQEIVVNHPSINGYKLIPNQVDKIVLLPDDSQNIVKIYYEIDKTINTFNYKVNYLLKDKNTVIHPQKIGTGYAFEEIDILPHPVIPGYKLSLNNPSKIIVLSDGSAELNIYYEVDSNQKIYDYQVLYYINGTTNPVPGKNNITKKAYIGEEITVDISTINGYKVVEGTNDKYIINHNNQQIIIYYEIDPLTSNYEGYVYYYIDGTTNLVPGITPNPVKFTGHHDKVFTIDHPINSQGYKVKANQPTTITIKSDNSARVEVFYEVDKTQKVYQYEIIYLIKDTVIQVPGKNIVTGMAYIGEEINIDLTPTTTGYKPVDGSPTKVKVKHNPTKIDIYYEVDQSQNTYFATVKHIIEETGLPLPGSNETKLYGYIGQEVTATPLSLNNGYKAKEGQNLKVSIKGDNTAEIIIFYIVDQTQKIYSYKVYYYLETKPTPVPGKAHILNGTAYINESVTLNFDPVPGYKVKNGQTQIVKITSSGLEFEVFYEVNTLENNFEGKVYYRVFGTEDLLNIPNNPKIHKGTAGEVITITPHPITNIGYKVKENQPTTITILADNTASVTVYYEVDQSQKVYSYSINYRIKDLNVNVPGVDDINGFAYIGEEINIPLEKGNGYKPVAGSANKLIVDVPDKKITILYEIDKTQNLFEGNIKYYIYPGTVHVPGISPNPKVVTGYHTEVINFVNQDKLPTGYKLRDNQPNSITITNDNSAEVIVYYEVDKSQTPYNYEIRHIVRKTGQNLPGRNSLIGKAYVNQEILIDISPINGYKAESGTLDKVTIDKDGFLHIVYYEPNESVSTFSGKIKYLYKNDDSLVSSALLGFANPRIYTGHVLQEFNVDKPNVLGYLVENANPEKLILQHDNSAEIIVYYVLNTSNIYHGKVYLKIDGTSNNVPGYEEYISVSGNADQIVTYIPPFVNGSGYIVKPGQTHNIKILADGSAEKTIYYIVDTNQKIYNYTVKYLIKGLNTPVPGKSEVTGKAYIKEKITINLDPVLGYKAASGNDLEVVITHNDQIIDIYYEPNQADNQFKAKVEYKIKNTKLKVPGISPNPITLKGYVGEKVAIPTPLGNGYKVDDGQELFIEILYDESATKTIYYVVDQSQTIYQYSVYYYIKGTTQLVPGKSHILNKKAYINQEITIDLSNGNGYKVVEGTNNKYIIDITTKIIKIYYEVDQLQNEFVGKVNYYIKGTTKKVPGVVQSETFKGYVGQVIDITPPQSSEGYKVDPTISLPVQLVIRVDNLAEVNVYYVVDENQKVYKYNIYYYLGQSGTEPVPGKDHILDKDAYIGEKIDINKDNVKGYKAIDSQINYFNVNQNPTNVIIRYEINKQDKQFTGKVYYKISLTDQLVPGLVGTTENPVTLTGYLGEEVDITYYQSNRGYIVDENQPRKLTLKYDNTAETTVYYIVDKNQRIYTYSIYYYIKNTTDPVPGKTNIINARAYIDEVVDLDLSDGNGYKALSTTPPNVTINEDNKVINVYYEVNTLSNQFKGYVKYELENGDDVPGINPSRKEFKGYIGEVINITHPVLTNGYKVKDGEPSSLTINGDNNAEIRVVYIVDKSQKILNYTIYYLIDQINGPVPGKPHVSGKAYINEVININQDATDTGYKVKASQPTTLTVDSDNKEETVYYIVDESQKVYTYNVLYRIEGTNDPVPGKADLLNQKAYINEEITVNVDPTNTGYKAVNPANNKFTINQKNVDIIVFYNIDKSQNQFTGTIKYIIEGTNTLVPGITNNPLIVKGYHTQEINISYPIVNTGYKVKSGQEDKITILYDNSAEIIVYYEVDENQKIYKYNIYYYLDGDKPVPGKDHILDRDAYIGEEILVDLNPTIGYKAKVGETQKFYVLSNPTTVKIYYEIDKSQTPYDYSIIYYIKDTTSPVPGKTNINGKAYINQYIPIEKSPGIGYKVVENTPNGINVSNNPTNFIVYYEVDQSQNQFTGTIKYYIKGSTVEVPGIPGGATKEVKGYVGQKFNIEHPVINTGYKVMANQPIEIIIKHDNTATEIVYYEIDESQLIWKYSILYRVHPSGEKIPYREDIIDAPAYIQKKIHVDISPIAGYKLYGSPDDFAIIDVDGKVVTIYYEIDTDQKFNYQVDYINSETNEKIKESLIAQAPVGKLQLVHPNIPGYQIVAGQTDFIVVNNKGTAKLVIKYNPNLNTNYFIEHYVEQLDGSYIIKETTNKQGKTDTQVSAEKNNYVGFTFDNSNINNLLTGKVKGDGTLTLKVYYNRNKFMVTFDTKGGNVINSKEYKYEQELGILEIPTKLGYDFVSWKDKQNNISYPQNHKVTSNINLYAEWNLTDFSVTIEGYTNEVTYGTQVHLTAKVNHPLINNATYKWTKNGVVVSTSKEIDINNVNESGIYKVEVTIDGVTRTQQIEIKIKKANFDLSNLRFENKQFEYDANTHKLEATGLPAGVTVKKYTNNEAINAGIYNAVVEFDYDKNNYNPVPNMNAVLTITKANLTVVANPSSKVFGENDPQEFTYSVTGFKGTDNKSLLTGKLARAIGEDVGNYDILLGTLKANLNYDITYTKAIFTITPAQIIGINIGSKNVVFNNKNQKLEVTGALPTDIIEYTYNGEVRNTPFEFKDAGTYVIDVKVKRDNYSDFVTQVTLNIAKFEISLNIHDKNSNRLENQVQLTYEMTIPVDKKLPEGLVDSSVFALYVQGFNNAVAGDYQILVEEKMANNFNITYVAGKYTVNRLKHKATFNAEGVSGYPLEMLVYEGDIITFPTNLVKEGYIFEKWNPEGILTMPENDITFTAVFKVDTSLSYNGKVYYRFRHNNQLVPIDRLGVTNNPVIVTGHADEEVEMTRHLVLGYIYENGQPLNIKIKTDGTAEYTLYLVKDVTKWVEVKFESGPNATLSGQQTFEILKDIPLNDIRQYNQITEPTILPNSGYFKNSVKWSPELNLTETLTNNKIYTARVNKKYKVNVYNEKPYDYKAKEVAYTGGLTYVLSTDNKLYVATNSHIETPFGIKNNQVGLIDPSYYDNKVIKSIISNDNGGIILLTEDSLIYAYKYASNIAGEFGQGDQDASVGFVKIDPNTYDNKIIKKVFSGVSNTYILTNDDDIYGCGSYVGDGTYNTYKTFVKLDREQLFNGNIVRDIKVANNNVVFLTTNNKAYMIGNNSNGQFGNGSISGNRVLSPQLINNPNLTNIIDFYYSSSGGYFWLNDQNELYVTGHNQNGAIYPDISTVGQKYTTFTKFNFNLEGNITKVSCSSFNTIILTDQNKLYFFGKKVIDYLGLPNENFLTPTLIDLNELSGKEIQEISMGIDFLIIKIENKLYYSGVSAGPGLFINGGNFIENTIKNLTEFKKTPNPYKQYEILSGEIINIGSDLPFKKKGYFDVDVLYTDPEMLNAYTDNSVIMPESDYNLYFEFRKDPTKWVKLRFESGPNALLINGKDYVEYEILKDVPLNDAEQTRLLIPNVIPNSGYFKNKQLWDQEISYNSSFSDDTTIRARVNKKYNVNVYTELQKEYNVKKAIVEDDNKFSAILTHENELYISIGYVSEFNQPVNSVYKVPLTHFENKEIKNIFGDKKLLYVQTTDNSLYVYKNKNNQFVNAHMGLGDITETDDFIKINPTTYDNQAIKDIQISSSATVILTENGDIYGVGDKIVIGLNLFQTSKFFEKLDRRYFNNKKITKISANDLMTFYLSEENKLYAAGRNSKGHLGIGSENDKLNTVYRTPGLFTHPNFNQVLDIDSTNSQTVIVNGDNNVFVSNSNTSYRLVKLDLSLDGNIVNAQISEYGILILTDANKLYYKGDDYLNQFLSVNNVQLQNYLTLIDNNLYFNEVISNIKSTENGFIVNLSNGKVLYSGNANKLKNKRGLGLFKYSTDPYKTYKVVAGDSIVINDLPYTIAGYNQVTNLYKDINFNDLFVNNTIVMPENEYNLYIELVKDDSQWTTITFLPNEFSSLKGVSRYDVIKGIPINDIKQLTPVIEPNIEPDSNCKIDPNSSWDGGYQQDLIIDEPRVFTARVFKEFKVKVYEELDPKEIHVNMFKNMLTSENEEPTLDFSVMLSKDGRLYVKGNLEHVPFFDKTGYAEEYILVDSSLYDDNQIDMIKFDNTVNYRIGGKPSGFILTKSGHVYTFGTVDTSIGFNTNKGKGFHRISESEFGNARVINGFIGYGLFTFITSKNKMYFFGNNENQRVPFSSENNILLPLEHDPSDFIPFHVKDIIVTHNTILVLLRNGEMCISRPSENKFSKILITKASDSNENVLIEKVIYAITTSMHGYIYHQVYAFTSDRKIRFFSGRTDYYSQLANKDDNISLAKTSLRMIAPLLDENLPNSITIKDIAFFENEIASTEGSFSKIMLPQFYVLSEDNKIFRLKNSGNELLKDSSNPIDKMFFGNIRFVDGTFDNMNDFYSLYKEYGIYNSEKIIISDLPYKKAGYKDVTDLFKEKNYQTTLDNNVEIMPKNDINLYFKRAYHNLHTFTYRIKYIDVETNSDNYQAFQGSKKVGWLRLPSPLSSNLNYELYRHEKSMFVDASNNSETIVMYIPKYVKYFENNFYEQLDFTYKKETLYKFAKQGTIVTIAPNIIEGYEFANSSDDLLTGTATGTPMLELIRYYKLKKYTINFDITDLASSILDSQEIRHGDKAKKPIGTEPTSPDVRYWSKVSKQTNLVNVYDFNIPVTNSFTLYPVLVEGLGNPEGSYPTNKVKDFELKRILNNYYPIDEIKDVYNSNGDAVNETIQIVIHEGIVYEKYKNEYYTYDTIETNDITIDGVQQKVTKKIIDYVFFDNTSNNYSKSYIKDYINKIIGYKSRIYNFRLIDLKIANVLSGTTIPEISEYAKARKEHNYNGIYSSSGDGFWTSTPQTNSTSSIIKKVKPYSQASLNVKSKYGVVLFETKSMDNLYPQKKVTEPGLINELRIASLETIKRIFSLPNDSQGAFPYQKLEWNLVHYGFNYYEKLGNDFYLFEPIEWNIAVGKNYKYTKKIIDASPFHRDNNGYVDYENSFIKNYINNVVTSKSNLENINLMTVEQVTNSPFSSNTNSDAGRGSDYTDYAKAKASNNTFHNYGFTVFVKTNIDFIDSYFLQDSRNSGTQFFRYYVRKNGMISSSKLDNILGIRLFQNE